MRAHVIRQGEHLAQIAARLGVDAETIWSHPDNRTLAELRRSPSILAPGDILFVPDEPSTPTAAVVQRSTNAFNGRVPSVEVSLKLRTGERPIRNQRVRVALPTPLELSADADGMVTFEAPIDAEDLTIELVGSTTKLRARLGHLDPIELESGLRARLANLGYMLPDESPLEKCAHGPRTRDDEEGRRRLHDALLCFQKDNRLPETGVADDATREALMAAQGA